MGAYQQMGHDSQNLLDEDHLGHFSGAILSPVDYPEPDVTAQIEAQRESSFEMLFDPQLYYPSNQRRHLSSWSYYPADVDTADHGSLEWWRELNRNLAECCQRFRPDAVCSPTVVPRRFSDEHYALNRQVASSLSEMLADTGIEVLQTVIVNLDELGSENRPQTIASIVTSGDQRTGRCYLILKADVDPRREIKDTDGLKGYMRMIRSLEGADVRVLVSHSSSDLVLWKAAGASDCATGKFWNLRRFTPSRWEPPSGGGGQVSYFFEEAAMAFLRESDLDRVLRKGLLSDSSISNPWGRRILAKREDEPGEAWLGDSWRQFMWWFANFEELLEEGAVDPDTHLEQAEEMWDRFEEIPILMEKRANDGSWLRPWRRAIVES